MTPTNVRFPDAVDAGLAEFARRTGLPKSTVVVTAVREWLTMQTFPGVVFRTVITGERRAALVVGPEIWSVADSWLAHKGRERKPSIVAATLGLPQREIETALAYWAANREEIDTQIANHHAAQDEALAAWQRRRELDAL
ncbi:hypothetical protein [Sporichthya sp.]|uniref:hypothetical protein n=1 Tax=Sporichthya sp. TaxID=65475 RepID=UPI0018008A59|nr:hypothetical protein [Sporichthya sp.]MBA3743757.1 hypothetical protein [Sporichthya sp.]